MDLFRFCFFAAFLCLAMKGNAQSSSIEVFGNAGGTFNTGKIQVAWTLGEMAVLQKPTPSGGSITEGFHQPLLSLFKVKDEGLAQVQIFPNPVQATLLIDVDQNETKEISASLSDTQGKVLIQLNRITAGRSNLDLSSLPTGVYFLSLQYKGESSLQTFKVVKVK